MNRLKSRSRASALASALCLLATHSMNAQAVSDPKADEKKEEAIELSPFVVEASEDDGYLARDTLAGTRVRTELQDVGAAISIVTPKFLQDTNSKNSADLLVYTAGTEVGGQSGNFAGTGDGPYSGTQYDSPVAGTRVRGLAAADNLRDFFLTDIPWDSYNTGRVDLQRGANSILFGIGSPAGIINNSINGASFKNSNRVSAQIATYGSYRGSADFNRVVLKDELSVRLSLLDDETNYRQKPAERNDRRYFGALRYDPKFLRIEGARTSFRANYENGKVDGRQPSITPPIDLITQWFTGMNKAVFPWQNDEALINPNSKANPWLGTAGLGGIFDNIIAQFPDANSGVQGNLFAADGAGYPSQASGLQSKDGGRYLGILGYADYAKNATLPGWAVGGYKPKSLTDRSIFDFYNNLLSGDNKRNWSKFEAYNLNLSQTFFDNKLGFELAYDKQNTKWGYKNFLRDGYNAITVDVMSTFIDGSANPNVGRAMTIGQGSAASGWTKRIRESVRATSFGELDFRDIVRNQPKLGWALGRQNFTASVSQQSADTTRASWYNYYVDEGYLPNAAASLGTGGRQIYTLSYLSGDLRGVSSPAGLNLSRIKAVQMPQAANVTQWNTDRQAFIQYNAPLVFPETFDEATRPYVDANHHEDRVDSQIFVWQGYFFGGSIVPTIGWRKDTADALDAGPPAKVKGVITNFNDGSWHLPSSPDDATDGRTYSTATGQTHTFSIVAHVPKPWLKKVPGGLGASVFYNRSQNFQPDASRFDVVGNRIASPTGKTKDYGFTISALNEKLILKINRYETHVSNQTMGKELGGGWAAGYVEAWGQQFAKNPGNTNWGTTSAASKYGAGKTVWWQPANTPTSNVIPGNFNSPYTQAALDAQYDIQQAAIDDWFAPENQIPDKMKAVWGMTDYATGGGSISNPYVAVTGDTVSKGTEYELIANPVEGLQLSFNASKTDARRLNMAQTFKDWIAKRTADFEGPMGDIRFWGGGNYVLAPGSSGTVRDFWKTTFLTSFDLSEALNNAAVSELRPWRFNGTVNYDVPRGVLKGFTFGGSYRWQDKIVTGFPYNATNTKYDVTRPYYGPTEESFDAWIGYTRKVYKNVNWRIQLNVRDLFASDKLIPITVQPDGTPAAYRIPEPRVITLTNTFEF